MLADKTALDAELQRLRAEVAAVKKAAEAKHDDHNYSEEETRDYFIDLLLKEAGWALTNDRDREYRVEGMPNKKGEGFVDYVLWGDDGKPLGLVEAKRTRRDARVGQQQAKLYADCLEKETEQRPVIFYTNGYEHWLWDDERYPPRPVQGFYKKSELELLIQRRTTRRPLRGAAIDGTIVERHYQEHAIRAVAESFEEKERRALLVMATGAGKTRTVLEIQEDEWWQDVTAPMLDHARRKLRDLVKLIDKGSRTTLYTDFEDELGADADVVLLDGVTAGDFERFRAKARAFLASHKDHLAIRRLRNAQPLTATDLAELERMLGKSGGFSAEDLERAKQEADGLGLFVRSLVGLDREAAKGALPAFLEALGAAFQALTSKVHPLALGDVFRARQQIASLATKLLRVHRQDREDIDRIVDTLARQLGSHDYLIARSEARELLGENMVPIDDTLEPLVWKLYLDFAAEMELGTPFEPAQVPVPPPTNGQPTPATLMQKLAMIESEVRADAAERHVRVLRMNTPAGVQVAAEVVQAGWVVGA